MPRAKPCLHRSRRAWSRREPAHSALHPHHQEWREQTLYSDTLFALLDLCYEEDAKADVDCNLVLTEGGDFVEVQGSGEEATFTQAQMDAMLVLARKGVTELCALQQQIIDSAMKPAQPTDLKKLADFFGKK